MSNQDFIKRVLIVVLAIVLLLSFWYLRQIWILAFAAIVIAVGLSVPSKMLQEFGVKRSTSLVISAAGVSIITVLIFYYLLPPLFSQIGVLGSQLPDILRRSYDAYEEVRLGGSYISTFLPTLDFSGVEQLEQMLDLQPGDLFDLLRTVLSSSTLLLGPLVEGLGLFASLFGNIFFVLFIAIFFLTEPTSYIKASLYLVPRDYQERMLQIWDELYDTLTTWIAAQTLSVTMTIVLVFLILGVLLRLPFALVVAVFAGIATFIPNIGAFLPIIPITIFAIAAPDFSQAPYWLLIYLAVYLAIQLFESNVLSPLIVKSELDIPSGALMLFQVVCATIFGALGLLLAVPLLAIVIAVIREVYSNDMLELGEAQIEVVSTPGRALRIEYGRKEDAEDIAKENVEEDGMAQIASNLVNTLAVATPAKTGILALREWISTLNKPVQAEDVAEDVKYEEEQEEYL